MLKLQFRDKSRPDMWLVDSLITIGSDASCDIVLKSDRVAAYHAELHIADNNIQFVHKAEAKSSFVNGALIATDMLLKAWDVIAIGGVEMELIDPLLNRSPRKTQASQATQVREVLSDWLIQSQTAPFSGQIFPINKPMVIGRDVQCDIAVPLPHVSRRHAQVFIQDGKLRIKDMGSSNGTYVNGEKKSEVELKNNDEVQLDEFRFKVIFTGDATESQQQAFHTTIRESESPKSSQHKSTSKYPTPSGMDTISEHQRLERAFFHGKSPTIRGKVYEVSSTGSPIGRMLGHHLSRDDTSVSARHVEIFKKGRFWSIKNNGAANGLLVNGRMTTRATLIDGDEVTIGGINLIFQCEGSSPRTLSFEDEGSSIDLGKVAIGIAVVGVLVVLAITIFGG